MAKKKTDFTQLSNAEINIKLKAFENEYNVKKDKIIQLVHELEELDNLFIEANKELSQRGLLD